MANIWTSRFCINNYAAFNLVRISLDNVSKLWKAHEQTPLFNIQYIIYNNKVCENKDNNILTHQSWARCNFNCERHFVRRSWSAAFFGTSFVELRFSVGNNYFWKLCRTKRISRTLDSCLFSVITILFRKLSIKKLR